MLAFERMDVYRAAMEFAGLVEDLVPARGHRELRDQLERASISIVLNISEGAGRKAPKDKARLYDIARGSATECVAVLGILKMKALVAPDLHARGYALLERVVMMLNKLISRFAGSDAAASC